MALPEKERFESFGINLPVVSVSAGMDSFFYKDETYMILGTSSATDLVRSDREQQFIVVSRLGDFYDAALEEKEDGFLYLNAFRTRPAPGKARKRKSDEE